MLYALDSAGDIRWYFTDGGVLGVHQLKNGHLMMPTSFLLKSMYYKAGLQEIDLSGKIYRQYMIPGGSTTISRNCRTAICWLPETVRIFPP